MACQLTLNVYTYLSILEAPASAKLATLTPKGVCQCFVLKPTTGKYFSINKKGVLGSFCRLLNKAKIYKIIEVKGSRLSIEKPLVIGSPLT